MSSSTIFGSASVETLSNNLSGIFYESAQEVLETIFFSSVFGPSEPLYLASSSIGETIITAELRFGGNCSGRLQVSLTEVSARSIASNFFGEDSPEDIDFSAVVQVVKELANMVCGSVLSRMDAKSVFSLSHPEIKPIETPSAEQFSVVASFELADGVMTSQIFFDPDPSTDGTAKQES